jgi:hypothetical protein
MKFLSTKAALAALLGLTLAVPAYSSPAPVSATATLDFGLPPGETTLSYPNVFDLLDKKELKLDITLQLDPGAQSPPPIIVRFDWIDAAGNPFFSPGVEVFPSPDNVVTYSATFTIPFCPPEVSVDFNNTGPYTVAIKGTFTHTCLVPDSGSFSAAAIGFLMAGRLWRRRQLAS